MAEDGGEGVGKGSERLLVTEAVRRICEQGRGLQWVAASEGCDGHYVVTDGPLFQKLFNAVRRRRVQRREGSAERPFSGMHRHFALLSGDGWGRTGSKFRLKAPVAAEAASRQQSKGPAPHRSSGSWFSRDCKYCYQCGQGCASEAQEQCHVCNCREWTRPQGQAASSWIRRLLSWVMVDLRTMLAAKRAGAQRQDDYVVTTSRGEALDALKGMVASAAAADVRQQQANDRHHTHHSIWELRGVHLGSGVCAGKTRDDLFLAFVIWAEQGPGIYNVSKAMRRLQAFAEFQEQHFQRFFSTPLEVQDASLSAYTFANIWLPQDPAGRRSLVIEVVEAPQTPHTEESIREFVRFYFLMVLCLCFDDLSVSGGVVFYYDLRRKFSFTDLYSIIQYEDVCDSALDVMIHSAPFSFLSYHFYLHHSARWWMQWCRRVYLYFDSTTPIGVTYTDEMIAQPPSSDGQLFTGSCMPAATVAAMAQHVANTCGRCGIPSGDQPSSDMGSGSSECDGSVYAPLEASAADELWGQDIDWTSFEEQPQCEQLWFNANLHRDSASLTAACSLQSAPDHSLDDEDHQDRQEEEEEEAATAAEEERGWTAHGVHGTSGEGEAAGQKRREPEGETHDHVTAHLHTYAAVHMNIPPQEFKSTALFRIKDILLLLRALEAGGGVRSCSEAPGASTGASAVSIFGFSRLFVDDVNGFNDGIRHMVAQVNRSSLRVHAWMNVKVFMRVRTLARVCACVSVSACVCVCARRWEIVRNNNNGMCGGWAWTWCAGRATLLARKWPSVPTAAHPSRL